MLTTCRHLAAKIAPCIMAEPLYIIDAAELAPFRQTPDEVHGYCPPFIDAALRNHLNDCCEWIGPGRAIVLSGDAIRDAYDGDAARGVLQVFVHELAHSVAIAASEPIEETALVAASVSDNYARFHAAPHEHDGHDHGGPFVRRCLHLWQRSIWAGQYFEPWQLCGGRRYRMSDAREYLEQLGDEPARLRGATFAEIESTPAPPAFAELWAADLLRME